MVERVAQLGLPPFSYEGCPVVFRDLFGEQGHPVRATVSEMGPLLPDLKDLQEMVRFVGDNAERFRTEYGNIAAASVGAIQRGLLALEEQGGDPAKPSLVFFFDEAHLLFSDAPKLLQEKIEQVVRLIRSKGAEVYFVKQNPLDLPETVLGQLGNRVQHALRAFTPREKKAVKAAADTFRANPKPDVVRAITELGVGEALVSVLDAKGSPTVVERARRTPSAASSAGRSSAAYWDPSSGCEADHRAGSTTITRSGCFSSPGGNEDDLLLLWQPRGHEIGQEEVPAVRDWLTGWMAKTKKAGRRGRPAFFKK